ncbi:Acetyltransferase, GNAT family [Streptococcus sp. DD11]|nr:Acetyltransferase, GNAT family [Streptococcus sp. DD11]
MSTIRPIKSEEVQLLEESLYQAIFVPEGIPAPSRSILQDPDLQMYIKGFGNSPDDWALIAQADGQVVGAVWGRLMRDYAIMMTRRLPYLSLSCPTIGGRELASS